MIAISNKVKPKINVQQLIHTPDNIKLLATYLTRMFGKEKAQQLFEEYSAKSSEENHDYLFGSNSLAYELGKRDLEFFCMYYLQSVFRNEEDCAEIAPVHRDIWKDIHNMIVKKTHDKQVYILPRGTGKSVFGNLATTIFCHVYKFKKYTVVCSSIGSTAQKFVKQIKDALMDNPYIEHTFGTLLEPNNKKYICNSNQLELTNRSMIESISSTSSMRGRKYGNTRIELAILDDYQDESDVATPEQRERKWKRFSDDVSYAMQKNNATLLGLGTLQNPEDFYARLLKLPTWKSRVEKGVLVDDLKELFENGHWAEIKKIYKTNDEDKLEQAKEYYSNHFEEMQYPLLWQSYWDCFKLANDYFEDPVSFEQEIQSNLESAGEKRFKTIITESPEEIESHDFIKTMLCIDPKGSNNKNKSTEDYCAFALGSIADNGIKYIRKGEIHKFEFDDYIKRTIQFLKDYPEITHVFIEKQVYSGSDLIRLRQLIAEDADFKGRHIEWINIHQNKNKNDKISTIVGAVNMGRIIFNEEDDEAIQQLREFINTKVSKHDDFPDIVSEFATRIDEIEEEVHKIKFHDRSLLF